MDSLGVTDAKECLDQLYRLAQKFSSSLKPMSLRLLIITDTHAMHDTCTGVGLGVSSAFKCLAPHVADSTLQDALFNPMRELQLKIVEVKPH